MMQPFPTALPRRRWRYAVAAALALLVCACASVQPPAPPATLSLIPAPADIERDPGRFVLRDGAALNVRSGNAAALGTARYFAAQLAGARGLHVDVRPYDGEAGADSIEFILDPRLLVRDDSGDEGYELRVASDRIRLAARSAHGLFNGAVTLWQLLTQQMTRQRRIDVPCVVITDHPRFAWRGLMLDSVRHFQTPREIERLLDQMALHKLDVFHWHLTDDQGWRLPVPKHPELTAIGAWRSPPGAHGTAARYGGFYSADQIREIVRYAAARYITVVPEIEMPGHAQAAIAAYPQLGVSGKRPPVSHDWGVHTYLYNVDDATFDFLQDVLDTVMRLFPGPYVHVGGDEAAKDQWQASVEVRQHMHALGITDEDALQSYFITRIGRYLQAHGRRLIGWDEILKGGLPPGAIVMSWQGAAGAVAAARLGHDTIMAPSPQLYFDHIQSARHDEPPGRPGVVSLADVYAYDPIPAGLNTAQAAHVLGAQGNLWTEYLDTPQRLEHAAFPRVDALAETLWSPHPRRAWRDFLTRLPAQLQRYRAVGIDYADSAFAVDIHPRISAHRTVQVRLTNQAHDGTIRYTLDGSVPDATSPVYRAPLSLPMPAQVRAATFDGAHRLAATRGERLDARALARRNSDTLRACKPAGQGLVLRLPGPSVNGGEGVYRVDLFDPCWIYPQVDLDAFGTADVSAAALPFRFQLWKDASKVVLRHTRQPGGTLQAHLDACTGPLLASAPLAGAAAGNGAASLHLTLPQRAGRHDVCFVFTRDRPDPMWAIDSVQLLPRAPNKGSAPR